eukprot:TRINITY_DN65628_c0_g1_i1.p1 TRINITY_DN65628_c0_g1~~TRINITY_DN65628_c0_g1_i1.p1  ORF type:complete len:105 (-),score=5.20 TRINITY_DN65628_c0_g1_i1:117-431(-)
MVQSQATCLVDTNFLSVFNFPLLSGNAGSALSDPHSVVITEEMAIRYFGSANAVGKTLTIRQDSVFMPYVVTAVAQNCPTGTWFSHKLPAWLTPTSSRSLISLC